jgi:metal-responsive CopG/Arc/MetJ family transcriptional regulator
MRQAVTVSLPTEISDALDALVQDEGTTRSEVVREALRRYLLQREFESVRRRMLPKFEAQGVITDEDVFERVS